MNGRLYRRAAVLILLTGLSFLPTPRPARASGFCDICYEAWACAEVKCERRGGQVTTLCACYHPPINYCAFGDCEGYDANIPSPDCTVIQWLEVRDSGDRTGRDA
jgi:hypothetical protein